MDVNRLFISVSLLAISSGVIVTRVTGQLFPYLPVAAFASLLPIIYLIFSINEDSRGLFSIYLFILILISSSVRVYIFHFPASMIGMDPDSYAISIQTIIQYANISHISSGFYQSIPLFHVLTAVYAQISALSTNGAMGMWPVVAGVTFPLFASIFCSYLSSNPKSVLASAALAAILSNSLEFSYKPIPNLMATILFLSLIIFIVDFLLSERVIYLIPLVILFISIIFAHKLHPVVVVLMMSAVIVTILFYTNYSGIIPTEFITHKMYFLFLSTIILISWASILISINMILVAIGLGLFMIIIYHMMTETKINKGTKYIQSIKLPWIIVVCFAALTTVQWVFVTRLLSSVLKYRILPLVKDYGITINSDNDQSTFAESVDPGYLDIFYHHSDILILLLTVSIGWVYLVTYKKDIRSIILLSIAGVWMALFPLALTVSSSGGIGAPRVMLIASPLGIAVVSASLFNNKKSIIKLVFVILIIFQLFSTGFVPDYPNQYREFLTQDEVESKKFGHKYIAENIYSDLFFSVESIDPTVRGNQYQSEKYNSIGSSILDKSIHENKYDYLMFRDIDVYRTQTGLAQAKLLWNPKSEYNTNKEYNKIYDNGDVSSYSIV